MQTNGSSESVQPEATYSSIATSTGLVLGTSASVTNGTTVLFEIGYDLSPDTYITLVAGIPSTPDLNGTGTVGQLAKLGTARCGPAILTAGYRIPIPGKLQPYVGAGVAHAIILDTAPYPASAPPQLRLCFTTVN